MIGSRLALALAMGASLAVSAPAQAGVVIALQDLESGAARVTHAFLEPERLKIEMRDGGILAAKDRETLIHYDDADRSWSEIDPNRLAAMRDAAQAVMKQRLAGLPEAQRKKIEEMMGGRMGADEDGPAVSLRKEGASKVGNWPCTVFGAYRGNAKDAEMCVAPLDEVGLTEPDIAMLRALMERARALALGQAATKALDFDTLDAAVGGKAIPLRVVQIEGGKPTHGFEVKAIERKDLDPKTFEVPAGYTKKEMHMPGMGAMGGMGDMGGGMGGPMMGGQMNGGPMMGAPDVQ
jgi:hypothetical protein